MMFKDDYEFNILKVTKKVHKTDHGICTYQSILNKNLNV